MPTKTQLKKRINKVHEQIDEEYKTEQKALDHFEKILHNNDDPEFNKLLHKILQVFEELYDLEEKEKRLVERLDGKDHTLKTKEIKTIIKVEKTIEEIENKIQFPPELINTKMLKKLIDAFKDEVKKQHQELTPKP